MTIHHPPADITLEPHEWYIANWRNLPPLPRPAPVPFQHAACLKRLRQVKIHKSGAWGWTTARIPQWPTPEEARFWLTALLESDNAADPAVLAGKLDSSLDLDPSTLPNRLREARKGCQPELVALLATLFEADVLAKVLAETNAQEDVFLPAYRRYVRPYLDAGQLAAVRSVLTSTIGNLPRRAHAISILQAGLTASVGLSDLVADILSDGRNLEYGYQTSQRPFLVLGLVDREQIARRVQPHYDASSAEVIRGFIAHLEDRVVGCFAESLKWASRADCEKCITELSRIRRASLAPLLMQLQATRRSPAAQRWLETYPELALEGLRPHLAAEELRATIRDYLRGLIRTEKHELVDRFLDSVGGPIAAEYWHDLQTTVAGLSVVEGARPAWFPPLTEVKLPKWLDVAHLPPILVENKPLSSSCIPTILAALRESTLEAPTALIGLLKQHAEMRSLDAFAQGVFERWLTACGEYSERWAMAAMGLLGGDGCCLRLEKEIERRSAQRAELGIRCLQTINSDQALASLYTVWKRHQIGHNVISQMRLQRGLSPEQLEDVAVPRLGLHEPNTIEFGAERFRLSLAPDLTPCLVDARHHRRADLPPMEDSDDPVKVDLARASWDVFRLRVNETIPAQRLRLESAMRYQRRWQAAFFSRTLLTHPLLIQIAQGLVWGVFEKNALRLAFRVVPGGCLDISGLPVTLQGEQQIGIVHPTHLTPDECLIWGDVLADHGLQPPFVQLNRDVFTVQEQEQGEVKCSRFVGRVVATPEFKAFLNAHGWQGQKYYSARVWKLFPESGQIGCIQLVATTYAEMLCLGATYGNPEVTIGELFFTRPKPTTKEFLHGGKHWLKLQDVEPQVFDEVVRAVR